MAKRSKFIPALIIYCLVLILLVGAVLFVLNKFLVAYEASVPDNAVEVYFEDHNRDYWLGEVNALIAGGFNEFSDSSATAEDFGLDLDADITWRSAGTDGDTPIYKVKLGSAPIATISLAPDAELDFGMHTWKVSDCSFDVGKDTSITVCVPLGCTAYINGIPVGEKYFTGTGVTGVTLEQDFDIAPDSAIYVVEGMRGPVKITAFDEDGLELEPVPVSNTEVAFLCDPEYSTSFYAAANAEVLINGSPVTGRHVSSVGSNLHETVEIRLYEFSDLYTDPQITVTVNGEELAPIMLSLGKCYIPGASVDISGSLVSFLDGFVRAHVAFATNKDNNSMGNFYTLANYLELNTEFYNTCFNTIEPMSWVDTSDLVFNSTGCYDLMPMPNGDIVCHITYDVSYVHATTPRDVTADYVVLVRPSGGGYKVVNMNPQL